MLNPGKKSGGVLIRAATVGGVETKSVGPSTPDDVPGRHVTVNQVVGYNMARWRTAAGITQAELGERLGGWSNATVSAAERSWDGKRIRQFTADEIVAIALELGVPVPALFLPPEDDGASVRYLFHPHNGGTCLDMAALFSLLLPETAEDPAPGKQWREAFEQATGRYLDAERGEELLASLRGWTTAEARAARLERMRGHRAAVLEMLADHDELAMALERDIRRGDQEDRP
jgi:transcriptional regulator with XRE-family HTH domain